MRSYLVGGAVRDALLGLPVRERDWVVVGATPEDMIAAGYKSVGRDFPVFLHPETHEEHALARTERKSGRGYHGFSFHTGAEVTIEEDLRRRDLTVNAIAQDEHGALVDPYGGRRDLEARVLRHVSEAFVEDPVRILRIARFHARFAPLGFSIAPETMALMRRMVAAGEADQLVPERVWQETARALMLDAPQVYIDDLRACGALARIMPELDALFGVPQPAQHHPEVDSGVHVLMALAAAAREAAPLPVRLAVLLHDLGKGATPPQQWPRHRGHEQAGAPLVRAFCERLRVPNRCRDLALAVAGEHLRVHRAAELKPSTMLDLVDSLRGLRDSEFFEQALLACRCDLRGRLGREQADYPQADRVRAARDAAARVQARDVMRAGLEGPAIGRKLRQARIAAIRRALRSKQDQQAGAEGQAIPGERHEAVAGDEAQ